MRATMTMVLRPGQSADELTDPTNKECPDCGGRLIRWGSARSRTIRDEGRQVQLRPARVRCHGCGTTHVVLPADVLVRRRDSVAVIGRAVRSYAGGSGARKTAAALGLPAETVRGWLRALRARLRSKGRRLTEVLAGAEHDARLAGFIGERALWQYLAYRSQGRLLTNTSWL